MEADMTDSSSTGGQATKRIRWIARGTGSLVAVFWLLMGVLSGISEPGQWSLELVIMGGLIVTSALDVLAAWWRR
jgi:hypothetical protein